MSDASIPILVAGLLCDHVITEAGTNKKSLIGVFDTVHSQAFPTSLPGIWLYTRLTDAQGKYRLRVTLLYLETEEPVLEAETNEVEIPDRLGYYEFSMKFPLVPVPREGTYEFQVFANDVYIGRVSLKAQQLK